MARIARKWFGRVDDKGKLVLSDPDGFMDQIRALAGKDVEVIVKRFIRKRTIKQNSFYWVYLHLIEEETGNDANYLHEYFRDKHLPPRFVEVTLNGVTAEIEIRPTTTELLTDQFNEYMAKIEMESGIPIPNREQVSA